MKNALVFIVIIFSYLLLLSFSSFSGIHPYGRVIFSYLCGEIQMDYNTNLSLFHHYYSKLNTFTRMSQKIDLPSSTVEKTSVQTPYENKGERLFKNISMNDAGSNWSKNATLVSDLYEQPSPDFKHAIDNSFQNSGVLAQISRETGYVASDPIPESSILLLFGSVLLGLFVSTRIHKRKSA